MQWFKEVENVKSLWHTDGQKDAILSFLWKSWNDLWPGEMTLQNIYLNGIPFFVVDVLTSGTFCFIILPKKSFWTCERIHKWWNKCRI